MKKLFIFTVIVAIILPNLAFAQEVRPSHTLTTYFKTFIDVDSNIRYLTDDLLITNQCKKRDIFAIHARNDQISKELIENYTTLDEDALNQLKLEYATLNLELKFLRKINQLTEEDGEQQLEEYLIDNAKRDYKQLAENQFPVFLAKYSESINEYQNCRGSWLALADKVKNIQNNAANIKNEWKNLKQTLKDLKNSVVDTPSGFYENTLSENLAGGIKNSATTSWNNLEREALEISSTLERLNLSPENATSQVLRSLSGQRQLSVGEIIASETDLISIVETVRNQEATADLTNELQNLQAELSISNNYNDNANFALLSSLLIANNAIVETSNTFKAEDKGLNDQAREIYRMQCR